MSLANMIGLNDVFHIWFQDESFLYCYIYCTCLLVKLWMEISEPVLPIRSTIRVGLILT